MRLSLFPRWLLRAFCTAAVAMASVSGAASLHEQVDAMIAKRAGDKTVAPAADDAEFFRRVSLDFGGAIPTADEARTFLAEKAPDKRAKLIERLLAAPEFGDRMAEVFHIQLMERLGDDDKWKAYLSDSFRANKPWDVMVREMISPDFRDEKLGGAGYFMTRRMEKVGQQETDYPGLTRDVGRLFMGVDLQCCQCHKHLTVKEYKQVDFNGLFFAISNTKLREPAGDFKTKWLSENLVEAKYEFTSVLNGTKAQTAPRVPFGSEVEIPKFGKGEEWLVPPDKKTKVEGVPKFSPLREVSQRLATPENRYFARNIANRLWWQLMGRGIVEPLDLQHADNPPSHPEVMDLLAQEITAHQFDLKWMLRELALTQTYQRTSVLPAGAEKVPEELFLAAKERPLSAEQLTRSFLRATGEEARVVEGKEKTAGGTAITRQGFAKAFTAALANAPREPELNVNPTLRAALFLRNNEFVLWALQRRPGNLTDRLAGLADDGTVADGIYFAVLSRPPVAEEREQVAKYLAKHAGDREKAIGHLAWAMLSSMEFFANH